MGEFHPSSRPFVEHRGGWHGVFAKYEKDPDRILVLKGVGDSLPDEMMNRTYFAESLEDFCGFIRNHRRSVGHAFVHKRSSQGSDPFDHLWAIDFLRGEKFHSEGGTISFY